MKQKTGKLTVITVLLLTVCIAAGAMGLPRLLGEGSVLICSGILDTRLPDVTAALTAAGLQITSTQAQEDWRCVTAKKK